MALNNTKVQFRNICGLALGVIFRRKASVFEVYKNAFVWINVPFHGYKAAGISRMPNPVGYRVPGRGFKSSQF